MRFSRRTCGIGELTNDLRVATTRRLRCLRHLMRWIVIIQPELGGEQAKRLCGDPLRLKVKLSIKGRMFIRVHAALENLRLPVEPPHALRFPNGDSFSPIISSEADHSPPGRAVRPAHKIVIRSGPRTPVFHHAPRANDYTA